MHGLPSILSLLCNKFNKFNNTRARMLDSVYHMYIYTTLADFSTKYLVMYKVYTDVGCIK